MTRDGKCALFFAVGALIGAASIMFGVILHDAKHEPMVTTLETCE